MWSWKALINIYSRGRAHNRLLNVTLYTSKFFEGLFMSNMNAYWMIKLSQGTAQHRQQHFNPGNTGTAECKSKALLKLPYQGSPKDGGSWKTGNFSHCSHYLSWGIVSIDCHFWHNCVNPPHPNIHLTLTWCCCLFGTNVAKYMSALLYQLQWWWRRRMPP